MSRMSSQSTISRAAARKEGRLLHSQGKDLAEIATALSEKGYKSLRTGGALTKSGVQQLLWKNNKNAIKERRRATAQAKTPRKIGRSNAVRQILLLKDVEASERIALALLVLE